MKAIKSISAIVSVVAISLAVSAFQQGAEARYASTVAYHACFGQGACIQSNGQPGCILNNGECVPDISKPLQILE